MKHNEYKFLKESNLVEGYDCSIENYVMLSDSFCVASVNAFKYVQDNYHNNLSQKHIKRLHKILFDGWRHGLSNVHVGKYRDCQVWVGDSVDTVS